MARRELGREELAIKLAVAVAVPGVDVASIVQLQREATQQALHDVTRARWHADEDLAASIVLDHHVFTLEAELRAAGRVHGTGARTVHALSDITLSLEPGEFLAVMGPSGSGKSTLLNLAGALDQPASGRVLIEGRDLAGLTTTELAAVRRQHIGFVFQDFNLIPSLTALENVSLPLELDGTRARTARGHALAAMEQVGVDDLADRLPADMSGGQAQRVAIARATAGPRRLLLADEATGALDSATGQEVIAVLRQRADDGAAVLMVTHEPRFAAWADRTVFLRDGRAVGATVRDDVGALLTEGGRS